MTRRILSAAILWCATALVIPKYEYILQRVRYTYACKTVGMISDGHIIPTRRRKRVIPSTYYRIIDLFIYVLKTQ